MVVLATMWIVLKPETVWPTVDQNLTLLTKRQRGSGGISLVIAMVVDHGYWVRLMKRRQMTYMNGQSAWIITLGNAIRPWITFFP